MRFTRGARARTQGQGRDLLSSSPVHFRKTLPFSSRAVIVSPAPATIEHEPHEPLHVRPGGEERADQHPGRKDEEARRVHGQEEGPPADESQDVKGKQHGNAYSD